MKTLGISGLVLVNEMHAMRVKRRGIEQSARIRLFSAVTRIISHRPRHHQNTVDVVVMPGMLESDPVLQNRISTELK